MVYRVADDDVIFWRERANLTWRAGESYTDRTGERVGKCRDAGSWPPVNRTRGVTVRARNTTATWLR